MAYVPGSPASSMTVAEAGRMLRTLKGTLKEITANNSNQDVRGLAIPALDAALSAIRDLIPDGSVISRVRDLIPVEAIQEGEPVRASDVLLVVDILLSALLPRSEQEGPKTVPGTWD
jgi:hypothetical protein